MSQRAAIVAEILRLYQETGATASEIARQVGQGMSRNAVLGVIHRTAAKGEIKLRGVEGVEKMQQADARHPPATGCRFPIGDFTLEEPQPNGLMRRVPNPSFRFCGKPLAQPDDGRRPPYCAEHGPTCFAKQTQRLSEAEITPIHQRARGRFQ